MAAAGIALHHKLRHVLGGGLDLPHAETHTIALPHAVAYNAPAAPDAMARIARALGTADAAQGLYELAGRLGATRALCEIGMPLDGIDQAVATTIANPYWNPRPLHGDGMGEMLLPAWDGGPPPGD